MNKYLRVWLILIISLTTCFAQFPKGVKSIDGSISWSKMSYDGDDLGSMLMFAPSFGYFVMENFEVKARFNLSRYSYDDLVEYSGSNGIGIDYYRNFQSLIGYIGGALNFDNIETIGSTNIEIGFLYGLNEHIYFDLGFDYKIGLGDNKLSTQTIGIGTFVVF